jgi:hypothetical protein
MFTDFRSRPRKDDKIIVTYFGTVHDNRVYSPDNYLAAMEGLPHPICDQIETRFIGRVVGGAQSSLTRTRAKVRLLGFMPKLDGIRELEKTDFLLLIATDPSSHAGKLFDYFGCGKPILALSPLGGEIDRLLRLTRTGWCADPWDPNAIREMTLAACRQLKQCSPAITPDMNAIRTYSWPQIIARFAAAVELIPAERVSFRSAQPVLPMSVGA